MTKSKRIYFPKGFLKKISWLKLRDTISDDNFILGVPVEDYKITAILKILFLLPKEDMYYKDIKHDSGHRMNKQFNSYLRFLTERGMIVKTAKIIKGVDNNITVPVYALTRRGKIFLELLS